MRSKYTAGLHGRLVVGLSIILIVASCSSTEEITFEPSPFTVVSGLLADPVDFSELGLQIQLPKGWAQVDSSGLDAFRRMQAGTAIYQEFYPIFSLGLYTDSASGAIAYIASVEEAEGNLEQVNERYRNFLLSRVDESALITDYFAINGLDVCYYLLHSGQIVNHKLLGETPAGKRFLMEYVIPAFANADMEPAVNSSIAAIRPTVTADSAAVTGD